MTSYTMPAIDEIRDNFAFMDGWEDKYAYIMELGRALPPMHMALKNDATQVHGCVSQVWIWADMADDGTIQWQADSDAAIVKGLCAIVLSSIRGIDARGLTGYDATALFEELGLKQHLSPSRSNGFFAMVARIRNIAEAMTKEIKP